MTQNEFHSLIDQITSKYDSVVKENMELKTKISELEQKLLLQSNQNKQNISTIITPEKQQTTSKKPSSHLWNSKSKIKPEWQQIPVEFSDSLLCVHSFDDDLIAFGGVDSEIVMFSLNSHKKLCNIIGHSGAINDITSNINTGLFASCSGDKTIQLWSRDSITSTANNDTIPTTSTFSEHTEPVYAIDFITTDGKIVSGGSDCMLKIWDVLSATNSIQTINCESAVTSLKKVPGSDGTFCASFENGKILLFDMRQNTSETSMPSINVKSRINSFSFLDKEPYNILMVSCDEKLRQIDVRKFDITHIQDAGRVVSRVKVRGDYVLMPSEIGRMRVLNMNANSLYIYDEIPFSYTISDGHLLNEDGSRGIFTSWDGTASIAKITQKLS